jgi:hypothetical protein
MDTSVGFSSAPEKALRQPLIYEKNPDWPGPLRLVVKTSHILRRYVGKPPTFVVGSLSPC